MRYLKLILLTSVILLILMIGFATNTIAQGDYYDGVREDRSISCWMAGEGYTCKFTQHLGLRYSLANNTMTIYHHYNDGLKRDWIYRSFYWDVTPEYFKWFENGSLKYNFTQFSPYERIYPITDYPWGGRNLTQIQFYLPGKTHSAEIKSEWSANGPIPNYWAFYLTYGPS